MSLRRLRAVALGLAVAGTLAGCHGTGTSSGGTPTPSASASAQYANAKAYKIVPNGSAHGDLTVSSAGFTESVLLADLYAGLLTRAGYTVRVISTPDSSALEAGLEQGTIDVAPQYAASYADQLAAMAKTDAGGTADLGQTTARLQTLAAHRGITVLSPTQAVDTYGFAITQKKSAAYNLTTMSRLSVLGPISLAADAECATRPTCQPGLQTTYGVTVGTLDPLGYDTQSAINAVANRHDQVALVRTTDARVTVAKLVLLTDDKHLQPADNVVPVVSTKSLAGKPELVGVLDKLSPVLSTADLAQLDFQVDVQLQRPEDAAANYLHAKGLV